MSFPFCAVSVHGQNVLSFTKRKKLGHIIYKALMIRRFSNQSTYSSTSLHEFFITMPPRELICYLLKCHKCCPLEERRTGCTNLPWNIKTKHRKSLYDHQEERKPLTCSFRRVSSPSNRTALPLPYIYTHPQLLTCTYMSIFRVTNDI